MFCYKCGSENSDDAIFCSKCGTTLSQSHPQQIEPQQPTKPGDVSVGATDRAVYGCAKGCGGPFLLLVEIIMVIVLTVIFSAFTFWFILNGNMNSPWAVASPFIFFVVFFIGTHYGKNFLWK